jgi:uncharacterized repeat protein (TIGR03803 family)
MRNILTNPHPIAISKVSPLGPTIALAFAVLLVIFAAQAARAQTFKVLHTFKGGNDGTGPTGGLIRDSAGNLYGATPDRGARGYGVLFKLDAKDKFTALYSFSGGKEGGGPTAI